MIGQNDCIVMVELKFGLVQYVRMCYMGGLDIQMLGPTRVKSGKERIFCFRCDDRCL